MKARKRKGPATNVDIADIRHALRLLREARTRLRMAQANNAANYVQRCIKSAEGACNNAQAQVARRMRGAT